MEVREKLMQIFKFLQEYNNMQNPPKKNIKQQLWYKYLSEAEESEFTKSILDQNHNNDDNYILMVRKPQFFNCPDLHEDLFDWVSFPWDDPFSDVENLKFRTFLNEDNIKRIENFEDDKNRVELYNKWVKQREVWANNERKSRNSLDLYNNLYELYMRIEQESEKVELLVGDGILHVRKDNGEDVHHPILIKKVVLKFFSETLEFIIEGIGEGVEFNFNLLRDIEFFNGEEIINYAKLTENKQFDPLSREQTSEFFCELVDKLSENGVFVDFDKEDTDTESCKFYIERNPVLFLRNRNSGFNDVISAIFEDMKCRDSFPEPLLNVLGLKFEENKYFYDEKNKLEAVNGIDEDILFSKEANEEQLMIAKYLENNSGVLVQGPPGTGKTHTIANLIGHLLANGKSVLVSSHTSKALTVLHDKIVEPLKPLCVSLLNDGNEQLESSIKGIVEYISTNNLQELIKESRLLKEERISILNRLRKEREDLILIKKNEYSPIVFQGQEYSPIYAAKIISSGKNQNSWIPGPVTELVKLPLTSEEIITLYKTNQSITQEEDQILNYYLPDVDELETPYEFGRLVDERQSLLNKEYDQIEDYWDNNLEKREIDVLKKMIEELNFNDKNILDKTDWRMAAIEAGTEGSLEKRPWENLLDKIYECYEFSKRNKVLFFESNPYIPNDLDVNNISNVLSFIIKNFNDSGKISVYLRVFNKDVKKIYEKCRINKNRLETIEDYKILYKYSILLEKRNELKMYWNKLIYANKGISYESLGKEPENQAYLYADEINKSLSWFSQNLVHMKFKFIKMGFDWDTFIKNYKSKLNIDSNLSIIKFVISQVLPEILEHEIDKCIVRDIEIKFNKMLEYLEKIEENKFIFKLKESIKNMNTEDFEKSYFKLVRLKECLGQKILREDLLIRLSYVAPSWSTSIRERIGIHGKSEICGCVNKAWEWIQLNQEIERRNRLDIDKIQENIDLLNDDLKRVTISLIEKKAWAKQIEKTDLEQRMALNGWKETVKKIGKGNSAKSAKYIKEARNLMSKCQAAVPVWIMPINRVIENFVPGKHHFDVVIVDEASQADILALPLLYYCKKIVIVGDDKQVTPDTIGIKTEGIDKLVDLYLNDIPNKHLFDEKTSLYQIVGRTFQPICLREHFRCVPKIIEFSNQIAYEGKIRALRDESSNPLNSPVIEYKVNDGQCEGKVNMIEAYEIASLVKACLEIEEYNNLTFGIISLLGNEQSEVIRKILMSKISEKEYWERKIQCGNPAQFQGDERDVCFLSLVDSSKGNTLLSMRSAEANDERFGKRFNVAASRAKNQVWVCHSLNAEKDLKNGDIRSQLIKYAKNSEIKIDETDSSYIISRDLPKKVYSFLLENNYNVTRRWKVGSYEIDLVVQYGNRRVAIDCEGEKFHSIQKVEEDIIRQTILERLGWRFIRVRGTKYFKDTISTCESIISQLKDYEIYPETLKINNKNDNLLREKVILRAQEIRNEWNSGQNLKTMKIKKVKNQLKKVSDLLQL